jgi:hypothetical protein
MKTTFLYSIAVRRPESIDEAKTDSARLGTVLRVFDELGLGRLRSRG